MEDIGAAEAIADGGEFVAIRLGLLGEDVESGVGACAEEFKVGVEGCGPLFGLVGIGGEFASAVHVECECGVTEFGQVDGPLVFIIGTSPPCMTDEHAGLRRRVGSDGIIVGVEALIGLIADGVVDGFGNDFRVCGRGVRCKCGEDGQCGEGGAVFHDWDSGVEVCGLILTNWLCGVCDCGWWETLSRNRRESGGRLKGHDVDDMLGDGCDVVAWPNGDVDIGRELIGLISDDGRDVVLQLRDERFGRGGVCTVDFDFDGVWCWECWECGGGEGCGFVALDEDDVAMLVERFKLLIRISVSGGVNGQVVTGDDRRGLCASGAMLV